MKNKLFLNTSIYTFGNLLPQAIGFILLPIYTKYLSSDGYGIISSMQVLSAILIVIQTFSLEKSIYRLYYDYKTEIEKKDYLGTIVISVFFISLLVTLLVLLFRTFVDNIFETIDFYPYYFYVVITCFFTTFSSVPKIYFQVKEKAFEFVSLSLLQFFLTTFLILWFVIYKNQGAIGYLKGGMVSSIIISPIFIWLNLEIINFNFKKKIFKESLLFSLPMVPGFLAAWILNQVDRIFIERIYGMGEVGIYSLAYKISTLVGVLFSAVNSAYSPMFYKIAAYEDQISAKQIIQTYNDYFFMFVIFIGFNLILFANEIFTIFFSEEFSEGLSFLPILVLSIMIYQIQGLFNLMVYQEKKIKEMVLIGVLGGIINIPFNFLFIPKFGMMGAAIATLLSYLIMFFRAYLYSKKCYFIEPNWLRISKFFFFSLFITFVLNAGMQELTALISLIIKLCTITLISVVLYAANVFDIRSFLKTAMSN